MDQNFDVIFHLAAFIPYGALDQTDERLTAVNVQLTKDLLRLYPDARFVLASSVSVFGKNPDRPLKINSASIDPEAYGHSKLLAENAVETHHSFAIVRFSSIIGPGMASVSFIPKIIENARRNGQITLLGDGARKQNYIDVRDASRLLWQCSKSNQNIKLLGIGTKSFSNTEVAECVSNTVHAEIQYTGEDTSPHFIYDGENMYDLVGFIPTFTLLQSIRDIVSV